MATPHLTSSQPPNTSGTRNRKLNACSGHLLIVKKTTTWTNKVFVITPIEEYFTMAAVYAYASSYNTGYGSSVVSDADALATQFINHWNTKTGTNAWTSGYKPLFAYYSRGWGPWAIRSKSDINLTNGPQIWEYGGSRRLLRFKTHALPVGNLSSFNAYLRFWNPSWCLMTALDMGGTVHCPNISHNNSGVVRFHFDNGVMPPTQMNAENYGEANFPVFANEGKGASGTSAPNGSLQFGSVYDVYGSHLDTASPSDYFYQQKTAIYMKGHTSTGGEISTDPYYYDFEITGNALKRLKECLPNGDIYMIAGAVPTNGLTASSTVGIAGNSTIMMYCSRIELIFKCSGGRINA